MDDQFKLSWLVAGKLAALWKSTVSGSVIASILGFTVTESQTGNVRFAFLVAGISGAIGAVCATVPRLILAVKEARESKSRIHQGETNNLIARIHELHAQSDATKDAAHADSVASLKAASSWFQTQSALTRLSKHAALAECARLQCRCIILEARLEKHSIEIPPEAKPLRDLHEVLEEEDKAMRKMIEARMSDVNIET